MKITLEIELNDIAVNVIKQFIGNKTVEQEIAYVVDDTLGEYLYNLTDDEYEVSVKPKE